MKLHHGNLLIALSLSVLVFSSCQKFYTKEEAIQHLKTDESFREYIQLKSDNEAALQKSFDKVATPQTVKKYKQAKANGDKAYLTSVRKQILDPLKANKKQEFITYAYLYKRYVHKLHIPKDEFTGILNKAYTDYHQKMGRTRKR